MPLSQKSFLALAALLAAFLIPLLSSSLRGLTHVLTCQEQAQTPFTVEITGSGPPRVISSTTITRGEEELLCGGLNLDLRARGAGQDSVDMIVSIGNATESLWRGTVSLAIEGGPTIPVDIGQIPPGETRSDTVELSFRPGVHDLNGSLLIGP